MLSRNFCKECVKVNFHNFHTVLAWLITFSADCKQTADNAHPGNDFRAPNPKSFQKVVFWRKIVDFCMFWILDPWGWKLAKGDPNGPNFWYLHHCKISTNLYIIMNIFPEFTLHFGTNWIFKFFTEFFMPFSALIQMLILKS